MKTSSSAAAVSLVAAAAASAAVIAVAAAPAVVVVAAAAAVPAAAALAVFYRGMGVNYMKYKNNKYKNWDKYKSWETTRYMHSTPDLPLCMSALSPYIYMNIYVCMLSQRHTTSDLDMHLAGAAT